MNKPMPYKALVSTLLQQPPAGPDGTRELMGANLWITPDDVAARPGYSERLAAEMARQIIAGGFDLEAMKRAAPHHDASLWDNHPFEGTGILGRDTWEILRGELATHNAGDHRGWDGRQAVWPFGHYDERYCWTALQVMRRYSPKYRQDAVSVVLFQRSCDIWRGFPYDLAMLTAVWKHLAGSQALGDCWWMIGSLHLYPRDVEDARMWVSP